MTRPPLLVPALAIAALLIAAPVAAKSTPDPKAQSASIEFDLPANNGLHAHLETFNGEVTLKVERKGHFVSYEVEGESTDAGLKVQFGKLGLIDVAFRPTKTRTETPPKGCRGPPSTFSEGLFVGTIEFIGERRYVRIEAVQAKGTMGVYRESEWQCPRHKGPAHLQGTPRPSALRLRERSEAEKEPATLTAVDYRCGCYFAAFTVRGSRGHGPSTFYGGKLEKREAMEISRVTFARAGASAFVFDHAAGTARVRPPQPFSGHGTFKRRPHSRDLWSSTIRVPLLGSDPVSIHGRSYRAKLARDLPGD
jgi:hypothetical protein